MVALMGAYGSGKTTLMNILGCLDRSTTGSYRFMGEDVSDFDRDELARLRALDANRSNIPLPKGPVPTNMKGMRQNMRGR